MTRIDPITVLDAYRWTGIAPTISNDFLYRDPHGQLRACPLAVTTLMAKGLKHDDVLQYCKEEFGLMATIGYCRAVCGSHGEWSEAQGVSRRILDISRPYQVGFVWGYDWNSLDPVIASYQPDYDLGFADGSTVRQVIEKVMGWDQPPPYVYVSE